MGKQAAGATSRGRDQGARKGSARVHVLDQRHLVNVALADTAEGPPPGPDEKRMKNPFRSSSTTQDADLPLREPQAESAAVVVRPLRPTVAARSHELLSTARMQQGREAAGPVPNSVPEPPARDPRAYPASPPRVEGAVRRTYSIEPVP